jgi:putative spermidine/putrescine transport system permease protein
MARGWRAAGPGQRFPADRSRAPMQIPDRAIPYLQILPLFLILLVFLGIPLALVVVVSFFDYDMFDIIPEFTLRNYVELFSSRLTYDLYLVTIGYALTTWAITLVVGFTVAYFLVFHVRSLLWQIALFLLCTVPFWTSNIIRMISWIPFLGRNGIINSALLSTGVVGQPLEFLLFSEFSTVLAYVHLYTLFMVVPIFNSMMRIDRSLIEAAADCRATGWQTIRTVVMPLSKPGIAIGSIFVVTLVMGDFFVVRIMSGGQSGNVVSAMQNEIALLQYPPAAASAVVLVVIVSLMVAAILKVVDVRRELSG